MKYGPVDVIVVAAGQPRFEGGVLRVLQDLAGSNTIRVLDALLLTMDDNGEVSGVDIEDLPGEDRAALGFIETGTRGMFDSSDSELLAEGMVPGSAVVALAIENRWAVELMNEMQRAGAEIAFTSRVPAPIVEDTLTPAGATM